jgi:hypothetical protein
VVSDLIFWKNKNQKIDYFFDKKKGQLFFTLEFHAAVRGEKVTFLPRGWGWRVWAHALRPRPQVEFKKWKKVFFFGEDGIFFAKLVFSAVICGIRLHLHLTSI